MVTAVPAVVEAAAAFFLLPEILVPMACLYVPAVEVSPCRRQRLPYAMLRLAQGPQRMCVQMGDGDSSRGVPNVVKLAQQLW